MIKVGEQQALMVVKRTDFGVYLGSGEDKVLLPKKYVDDEVEIGDAIDVFVYRDSQDRPVATTKKPLIHLGEVALLKVKQVTKIGAFLDWGLEKDLFLPFKEMTTQVSEGKSYLVALYVDKSARLAATMKVYPYLKMNSTYHTGDEIRGTAYELIDKFGLFVAVDNCFQGLIPKKALYGNIQVGDEVRATISHVHEDGKLELAVRKVSYLEMEEDAAKILKELELRDGILKLGDKSDPEEIKNTLQMSKAAFKRACGRLMKEGLITIGEYAIQKK